MDLSHSFVSAWIKIDNGASIPQSGQILDQLSNEKSKGGDILYETKDSYFSIFDPATLIIVGMVIVLAIAGYFFFSNKKRNNKS